MRAEKFVLSTELHKLNEQLTGKKRLSMAGQSDFPGGVNVAREAMNNKHKKQHLAIDNPEFPYLYDGKENIAGEFSSHYKISKKPYRVVSICKKYDRMLGGHSRYGLYFLHCPDDDSYMVINRKEVESLTESFGFEFNNEFLDALEEGEYIPTGTRLYSSRSYDEYMNIGVGVHARTLFAVDPAVQDDAIVISESFANRMVANDVTTKLVPINTNTVILDLYGRNGEYKGFPDIGETIKNGVVCATRKVKETQMLSEMRDSALRAANPQDVIYYGQGEVTDITVYCNKPTIEKTYVTDQILRYYNDSIWYWRSVYQTCKKIINSGSKKIDPEIHRWMRLAMNYLDGDALWALNDNVFDNIVVAIEVREKLRLETGRKITGCEYYGRCKIVLIAGTPLEPVSSKLFE